MSETVKVNVSLPKPVKVRVSGLVITIAKDLPLPTSENEGSVLRSKDGKWVVESVDDVPTEKSERLVKSGGVKKQIYPVGSVYTSVSNENPGTIFDGTWELIDKEFAPINVNDSADQYFTPESNISAVTTRMSRAGNTITIGCYFANTAAVTDATLTLGTYNLQKIGITGFPIPNRFLAYTDNGGAILMTQISEKGVVISYDYLGGASLPAENTFYFTTTMTIPPKNMLDSACNKFYWKRTA